jgi:hypothetical protein
LLKLGFAVAQSTVAKYMAKIDGSPSGQSWGTFLRNHMPHILNTHPSDQRPQTGKTSSA